MATPARDTCLDGSPLHGRVKHENASLVEGQTMHGGGDASASFVRPQIDPSHSLSGSELQQTKIEQSLPFHICCIMSSYMTCPSRAIIDIN